LTYPSYPSWLLRMESVRDLLIHPAAVRV